MPLAGVSDSFFWLSCLRQDGLPVSSVVLAELFPVTDKASESKYELLRRRYNSFDARGGVGSNDGVPLSNWVDSVLEEFLNYPHSRWDKGSSVPNRFKVTTMFGEKLFPQRVLYKDSEKKEPIFLVSTDRVKEIGRGKGRTAYGKFLELLRETGVRLGIITNGIQFRLCYAGLDHDSWVQWEAGNWFEEEELRDELHGFYALLGEYGTKSRDGHDFPLLQAIEATRTKQGELAGVMSVHVRESVEILIKHLNDLLKKEPGCLDVVYRQPAERKNASECQDSNNLSDFNLITKKEVLDAVYQAAVRIVMRVVVSLFAEAKGLLSRSDYAYDNSYGVNGLLEQLKNARMYEGLSVLGERKTSWSRLLSLFNLLYEGSYHSSLPVPCYGGVLFKPGNPDDSDPVIRALAIFENKNMSAKGGFEISDSEIYSILVKLTTAKVRIKHGKTYVWVSGPVDFSELRTEYIGMMYEGLLDFELKSSDQVMVFLKLGMEPVLPLDLLEKLDDNGLKNLVDKLIEEEKKKKKADEEQAESEDDTSQTEEPEEEVIEEEQDEESEEESSCSEEDSNYKRTLEWAKKLVKIAKPVKKPKGKKSAKYYDDQECLRQAKKLIGNVVDAGSMYLVRWGGTRKGTGTFYTPPGLAIPTTHRAIEPLVYNTPSDPENPDSKPIPRKPEEILSVKVCDPSCGSGSFLVAALKYITDALYDSLIYHCGINDKANSQSVTLPFGKIAEGSEVEDQIPCQPSDDDFAIKVKQRLRRYVAEWCLYGVDLNPLAVELCKLSLWVETMDNELPFNFLDHKIKAGNSLVGCWFDRYRDYPALAWLREGGDKNHNGVHYKKDEWTIAIKDVYNNRVKPEMADMLAGLTGILGGTAHQMDLPFDDDFMKRPGMDIDTHNEAEKIFIRMHNLPLSAAGLEEKEKVYRESFINNPELNKLKERFDLWCAVWFWDADLLYEREMTDVEKALHKTRKKIRADFVLKEEIPSPKYFYKPTEEIRKNVRQLAAKHGFFHWELEFPDVFTKTRKGFDVILGNPPWDVQKPLSMEFFSNYDPIYRTYGKQEALTTQKSLFGKDKEIERSWIGYSAVFKSRGNFVKYSARPFGLPADDGTCIFSLSRNKNENDMLHKIWQKQREQRTGFSDPMHPYTYQGSADLNTYKMFLEMAHAVMKNSGRMGIIVPSGVYTDKGTMELRKLFLDKCRWEWLFSFENKLSIFNIHKSQKFAAIIIEKAGTTEFVKTSFMNHELKRWEDKSVVYLTMNKNQVSRFSPFNKVIMEIRTDLDLGIIEKIYAHSVLLGWQGEDGWGIEYNTEFHMTNDSSLFDPIGKFINRGYEPDGYGRWIDQKGDVALPLYEGRMIGQFDFSEKGWVKGKGRSAEWRDIPFEDKVIEPQYLMREEDFIKTNKSIAEDKLTYMHIGSATNERSFISSFINYFPAGNSLGVLLINNSYRLEKENILDWGRLISLLQSRIKVNNLRTNDFPRERCNELMDNCHFNKVIDENRKDFVVAWLNSLINADAILGINNPNDLAKSILTSHLLCKGLDILDSREIRVFNRLILEAAFPSVFENWQLVNLFTFKQLIPILDSFTCDYVLRSRLGGINLNWFVMEETPLPKKTMGQLVRDFMIKATAKLVLIHKSFCKHWLSLKSKFTELTKVNWCSLWAITDHERLRLRCILDAIVAELYGLDFDDFAWILRHDSSDPKGFWRVDKEKDIELRHTTLALAAFRDLKSMGLDRFCLLNDGEGWMIPETLTYKLGEDGVMEFDTPDGITVSVRSGLGERFLPWQLEGTPEESWEECKMHARNILGDGFDDFMKQIHTGYDSDNTNGRTNTQTAFEDTMEKETGKGGGSQPDTQKAYPAEPYEDTDKKGKKDITGQMSLLEPEAEQLKMFD